MAEAAKSLKVFVSYSRTDVNFADQLVLALEDKGFESILDRHDMSGGENWRERLGKLILSADAVAFILTVKSATSEICAWEVEEARRLGKRILPVTPASINGVTPPAALGDLNWIPFYDEPAIPGSGFYYGVKRLMEALSVDLDWLRAQTRYSERAQEWSKARADDLLLRGEALKDAEGWLARTPSGAHPPDLVREYLRASSDAEQHRQAAAKAQVEEREQALKTAEAAVAERQAAIADKMKMDRRLRVLSIGALALGVVFVATAFAGVWYSTRRSIDVNIQRAAQYAAAAQQLSDEGDHAKALLTAVSGDPAAQQGLIERYVRPDGYPDLMAALERAYTTLRLSAYYPVPDFPMVTAFTPDGLQFITTNISSNAQTVSTKLWRAGEAEPFIPFGGEDRPLDMAAYSANGAYVVSSVRAEPIEIRKAGVVAPEWSFSADEVDKDFYGAATMSISDDGATVAVGFANGDAGVWRRGQAKAVAAYGPTDGAVQLVALSPDGKRIALAMTDGFEIRDLEGKEPRQEFKLLSELRALQFSNDGSLVMSLTVEGKIRINDVATGREGMTYVDPESPIGAVAFSPDGLSIAMGRIDGVVQTLAIYGRSPPVIIGGHAEPLIGLAYSLDGLRVASGSFDQTVRVWSIAEKAQVKAINDPAKAFRTGAVLPDGETIVFGRADGKLEIVRGGGAAPETRPGISDGRVTQIAALPGGNEVIVLDEDHALARIGLAGDAPPVKFEGPDSPTASIAISPDGKMLLAASYSGAMLWQVDKPEKPVWVADKFPDGAAINVSFSPDGQHYIIGGITHIEVWKLGAEKPADVFEGIQYQGESFAFVPGTDTYMLTFGNGRIQQRKVGGAAPIHAYVGHAIKVQSTSFSADGSLMLTAGDEGAFLWRIGHSYPVASLTDAPVTWAALMPDGKRAVLLDRSSGEARTWTMDPILFAEPKDKAKMACEALAKAGLLRISADDRLRYPVLAMAPEEPCSDFGITAKAPGVEAAAAVGSP